MKSFSEYSEIWNKLHCEWIDKRNNAMADYCENLILEAKKAYYDTGNPIMCDAYYDSLEWKLRTLRPDSEVLEKVRSLEIKSFSTLNSLRMALNK